MRPDSKLISKLFFRLIPVQILLVVIGDINGFNDNKKHNIDMRISIVKDDIIISIKDNCRLFNPEEAEALFNPEDVTHKIGIRMVDKISKSMIYQNTLGLNVLTITI